MRSLRIGFLPAVFLFAVLCGMASAQQPTSWTSQDKLTLTYFFYWYNAPAGFHWGENPITGLTLHPPDSYLSTYSFTNVVFHQRELSDMASAGIDVVLPVYWGNAGNVSTWSVPGLQLMVQAEEAMAQAGQPAPKIGMFEDSTSLQASNGGVKPDLTTAAGKSLLYGHVHNFFSNVPKRFWAMIDGRPILVLYYATYASAYDQSTFDYVSQQFQQDFGTTPYIIRERSWKGIVTDGAYAWGAAVSGPIIVGDVASVGPGFDNLAVSGPQGQGRLIVADRLCGGFYQRQWDQVLSCGARLVLVETWNELHEGTGISAMREYGRRYIDQTAQSVARWKPSNPARPAMVWTSLGPRGYESGLYRAVNGGDGVLLTTRVAGHDAVYTDRSSAPPSYYVYLGLNDQFLPARPASVWVTVEYLDTGSTPWRLEYDGANNPYTATALVATQNTGLWKRQTFYLPDAVFQKRENGGSDLRIDDYNTKGVVHYFNRVWITKSPPSGQPPQMPVLPDLAVQAGNSVDVPLSALDSSGRLLPVSLASVPGFASVQGSGGAQMIYLAPSLTDAVCADVTGPGVTSSPFYVITAVANDPNSQPGSGATTFSVNVTTPPPVIKAIYDPWNYTSGVAPGAWVTISGTGLAPGAPQTWNPTGTQLPTTLNKVMVFINSSPAVLNYVSATQINALVPSTVAPGPAQVVVEWNGINSSPFTVTAAPTLPAIYAPPNADGSTFYVTAALAGTGTLVGNSATDPRVVRTVQPGDTLDLYMVGLGGTQDPSKFVTNQVFSGAYPVTARVTATIGTEAATVLFAGLISPGLYLVRLQVPADLAPGPQPTQVSAGSSQTRSAILMVDAAH